MEESLEVGCEVREELVIPPTGDGVPRRRLAHFLAPTVQSADASDLELPLHCLSSLPPVFEPTEWPVKVHGWRCPQEGWKTWVGKMAALHESTWKKVGIHDAILNSTFRIRQNFDIVLGLAERWSSETMSFIFSWGEATITLEDMMIAGYSVLGTQAFSPLETYGLKKTEEKLNQARREFSRISQNATHGNWMKKFMNSGSEIEHEAFLALWLSRFVFSCSVSTIDKSLFPIAVHLASGTRLALAPAVLASIYRDLSLLKQKIVDSAKLDEQEKKAIELGVVTCPQFPLVQIWAWERFLHLRPEPNLIKSGEPRFARWHERTIAVENVRIVLDSAKEDFEWRPYVKNVTNWNFPKFYGEKEMWISVDPNLSEELQSFARCLRISELVGFESVVEQYLPHRVAMQFGMDQDLPAYVARANETRDSAWDFYNRPISCSSLYIPSRLYEAAVTTRNFKWWKQSMTRLQGASDRVSPRIGKSQKRSKGVKESSLTDGSASGGLTSKMLPLDILRMKAANDSPFPPGFAPKSDFIVARGEDDLTIAEAFRLSKRPHVGNTQVCVSENSSGLSQFLSLAVGPLAGKVMQNEPVKEEPATDSIASTPEGTELEEKIMQNKAVTGGLGTAGENATGSKANSREMQLGKRIMQNESVKVESETIAEHATSLHHDRARMKGDVRDAGRNAIETLALQLECRVSKLEKIVAKLLAANGHKLPVNPVAFP